MTRIRPGGGLAVILDALTKPETDSTVRLVTHSLGGAPAETHETRMGVPTVISRRLTFAAGGEVILHDDAVVAVVLHVVPTASAPGGVALGEWVAGASADSTLDDFARAFDSAPQFVGFGQPYFAVDGGYASVNFVDNRGWKEPGNLHSVTVTGKKPGLALRPEDDACPVCSHLLVRDAPDGVDVDATVASLAAALEASLITEDVHWVRLADLQPLHESGLMARVESQLRCTACRRIMCFTLFSEAPATFGYHVLNDAQRRPLAIIPPVAQWGSAARIAQEREGMRYVDHEPGSWFLVEQQGALYLDCRYIYSSMADDSALVRLDDAEAEKYGPGGHDYITSLARAVDGSRPFREDSPYFARDLYRGTDGRAYRDAVAGAIVNHTWLAQQRASHEP